MKEKYNWNALKTEFVTGDITVAALAKKHNINKQIGYYITGRHQNQRLFDIFRIKAFAEKSIDISDIHIQ